MIAAALLLAAAVSPGAFRIEALRREAAAKPAQDSVRLELARALIERHRETGSREMLAEAQRQISATGAGGFERRKLETALLLERGQYRAALDSARALNRRAPDDLELYGFIADAETGLGNFSAAVEAVQWMLDLRPDDMSGQLRAADLRAAHGDRNGAIAMLTDILERTGTPDVSLRAAALTRLARLSLRGGKPSRARRLREEALKLLPDYRPALELEKTR